MGKPHLFELREQVVALVEEGNRRDLTLFSL